MAVPLQKIDPNRRVYVYRKLSGRGYRCCDPIYSVMQGGRVLSHRRRLLLRDVEFRVRAGGRARVLRTRSKNVHAFAIGYLVDSAMGITSNGRDLPVRIKYDPYRYPFFYDIENERPVTRAVAALLNEHGISAAYTGSERKLLTTASDPGRVLV